MPHECTNCNRTFPDGSKEMLSGCPDCGGNKFRYRPEGGRLAESDRSPERGSDRSRSETPPDRSRRESPPDRSGGGSRTRAAETVSNAASTLRDIVGGPDDEPTGSTGSDGVDETRGAARPDAEDSTGPDAGDSTGSEADPTADTENAGGMADTENAAQASARSSVVDPDEIDTAAGSDPAGLGSTNVDSTAVAESGAGSVRERRGSGRSSETGPCPDQSRTDSGPETGDETGSGDPPDPDDGTGSNIEDLRAELNDQFESIKIVEPGQYELNLMELYDREEYIISLKEDGRYVIEVPETWRGDGP